jgi:hypothetical protein
LIGINLFKSVKLKTKYLGLSEGRLISCSIEYRFTPMMK